MAHKVYSFHNGPDQISKPGTKHNAYQAKPIDHFQGGLKRHPFFKKIHTTVNQRYMYRNLKAIYILRYVYNRSEKFFEA